MALRRTFVHVCADLCRMSHVRDSLVISFAAETCIVKTARCAPMVFKTLVGLF